MCKKQVDKLYHLINIIPVKLAIVLDVDNLE